MASTEQHSVAELDAPLSEAEGPERSKTIRNVSLSVISPSPDMPRVCCYGAEYRCRVNKLAVPRRSYSELVRTTGCVMFTFG